MIPGTPHGFRQISKKDRRLQRDAIVPAVQQLLHNDPISQQKIIALETWCRAHDTQTFWQRLRWIIVGQNRMATFILDLDGTCLQFHGKRWLPGVVDKLSALSAAGHMIVFITMRGPQDVGTDWSLEHTQAALAELAFPYQILTGQQSPRVLIDDHPPVAMHAETNNAESWMRELLRG